MMVSNNGWNAWIECQDVFTAITINQTSNKKLVVNKSSTKTYQGSC